MTGHHRTYPPRHRTVRVRFVPDAQPSPGRVHRIVALEAARWHVSAAGLDNRIRCESTWQWWETYTGHIGLLQFLPETFSRGLSSMPRKVIVTVRRRVMRPTRYVTTYSNGHHRGRSGYRVPVTRTRIYTGRIPSSPSIFHGWAQIRIGAQAMAGRSAVSDGEWACR